MENMQVVVVGAHLTGQPLNGQLTERAARLVKACRTAPDYFLYALAGTMPPKPGLKRVAAGTGYAIAVEVWEMPVEKFGGFVALMSAPLGIGSVKLDDGTERKGFICEPYALEQAQDISSYGGWLDYLQAAAHRPVLPAAI